jgi:hypothetical protein
MPDPSTIFAWIVTMLAGLAVLAVLTYVIVWSVLGIRRTIIVHRRRTMAPASSRYWPEHSAATVIESIIPPPAP